MENPQAKRGHQGLTTLDAMFLVGSAAVGLGVREGIWRGLFHDWYFFIIRDGQQGGRDWTATGLVVYSSECLSLLIPIAAAWMLLLPLLRLRTPQPLWRRVWRQPGMAACLAAMIGWLWAIITVAVAAGLSAAMPPRVPLDLVRWAQKFLVDELFMYVGLAVAATWAFQLCSGQWRRPVDTIDRLGRFVGVVWILIGLSWALREYMGVI